MYLINSFLYCGIICCIAQIILDNTKLTVGHITSIFVVIGAFLDSFNIYDKIILKVGGGAMLPIVSFGHSLTHGSMAGAKIAGYIGIFSGMFNFTAAGISCAIVCSFIFYLLFKPKN